MKEFNKIYRSVLAVCAIATTISVWDYTNLDEYKKEIESLKYDAERSKSRIRYIEESKRFEVDHWRELYYRCSKENTTPMVQIVPETVQCQIEEGKVTLDTHNICKVNKEGIIYFTAPYTGTYRFIDLGKAKVIKKVDE